MNTQAEDLKQLIIDAEEARLAYIKAMDEAKVFVGCKNPKTLVKDPEFQKYAQKVVNAKKLWYDYNTVVLLEARKK